MKDTRTAGTSWWWIGAALSLVAASACAPKVDRRQTDIMANTGRVSVSTAVLRARVNDLVDHLAGRIEQTVDQIAADADNPGARRRAVALKMDAVPAVYTAGYRADPLAAALDVWVLTFQFSRHVETGAGRDTFGARQQLVQDTARGLIADTDAVMKAIVIRPEYFDQARSRVEGWATAHPIDHAFTTRTSGASLLTELRADQQDAFVAVGTVADTIENLSERLNAFAAQLPKQARWQAEIFAMDIAAAINLERTIADVHDVGAAARQASDVLGDAGAAARQASALLEEIPGRIEAEREMLAAEGRAVLEGANGLREQALEYMTSERLAVIAAARQERIALADALRQERIAALVEVDAIKTRAVDEGLAGLRDLVDYALWRAAAMLAALMLVALMLAVIGYRLTIGRSRGLAVS